MSLPTLSSIPAMWSNWVKKNCVLVICRKCIAITMCTECGQKLIVHMTLTLLSPPKEEKDNIHHPFYIIMRLLPYTSENMMCPERMFGPISHFSRHTIHKMELNWIKHKLLKSAAGSCNFIGRRQLLTTIKSKNLNTECLPYSETEKHEK